MTSNWFIWILKLLNSVKKLSVKKNPSKVYTITDAYEVALQLGSVFIKRGHVSLNSAVFGRLNYPSEICYVSISTIIWQYNMVDMLICERVSSCSWIFMKNLLKSLEFCFSAKFKIQLSQVVVGNQVLCLDIEEKANFHHLDSIQAKLVMVDCERMISDLGQLRIHTIFCFNFCKKF